MAKSLRSWLYRELNFISRAMLSARVASLLSRFDRVLLAIHDADTLWLRPSSQRITDDPSSPRLAAWMRDRKRRISGVQLVHHARVSLKEGMGPGSFFSLAQWAAISGVASSEPLPTSREGGDSIMLAHGARLPISMSRDLTIRARLSAQ